LSTQDVVYMLHGMGIATGVDLERLVACASRVSALVWHELPSKYLKAALGAQARKGRAA